MVKADQRSKILVMAGAMLAYCATPWFGFVFDDRKDVLANPTLLHLSSIPGYFVHAGGYLVGNPSFYRPVSGAWTNLNYFLFGLHSAGWHIALLLLHCVAAFLCYRVVLAVMQDAAIATLAALLFAIHPVHVESVAWISGCPDPLAAVFIFLALLFHLRAQEKWQFYLLALAAFAASLLSKETALVFPLLIVVHTLLLGDQPNRFGAVLKRAGPYFLVAAAYIAVRIHILGTFSHTLTPLPWKTQLLTLPSLAVFYARLLCWPAGLSPFYDTPYIKTASFSGFLIPLLVLLAMSALLVWWTRGLRSATDKEEHHSQQAIFFVAWMVLFLVPALNLSAFEPGEIAHDRYLYLPSIGFCALVAIALKQLAEKLHLRQPIRLFATAALATIFCVATIAQTLFWKDDLSLYKRGANIAPNNINAESNLANIYLESGNMAQGIALHQQILKLKPQFVDSYFNLGLAYYNLGDFTQAQSYLQQAIALRPVGGSYFYLGLAQFRKGDLTSAEQSLQRATQLGRPQPDFYAALGVLYETEGRLSLALPELEKALALNPGNSNVRNEVAKVRRQLGQTP